MEKSRAELKRDRRCVSQVREGRRGTPERSKRPKGKKEDHKALDAPEKAPLSSRRKATHSPAEISMAFRSRSKVRQSTEVTTTAQRPEDEPNQRRRSRFKTWTTFRLAGLPITYKQRSVDEDEAETIIREVLKLSEDTQIYLESLAKLASSMHQTATIRFSNIPGEIEERLQDGDETNFQLLDGKKKFTLTLDTHFEGLTPLCSPQDADHKLDVIALHGLGGHAFGAYKAKGDSYMWLRDGLRESMPSAKVSTYGYDSQLVGSHSFQVLSDLGSRFKHELVNEIRERDRSGKIIPIALFGLSLGGLVIKEALRQLVKQETEILKSVQALFFFGTPNQGMDISSLVAMVHGQPNEDFLRSLGKESQELQRLEEMWDDIVSGPQTVSKNLKIYSFYETLRSPTAVQMESGLWEMSGESRVLVNKNSATNGRSWERGNNYVIAVNATHENLANFKSSNDSTYRLIESWLKQIFEGNQSNYAEGSLPPDEQELLDSCLASLSTHEEEYRYEQIYDSTENDTCQWIFKRKAYKEWLSTTCQSVLRIRGNPGVGKSTVLKQALQTYKKEHRPHDVVVASYFCYGGGKDLQKSPLGFYRWLLRQIIPHFPKVFWDVVLECRTRNQTEAYNGESWSWRPEKLQKYLKIRLPEACSRRPITIFIDALDELSDDHRTEFHDFINTLIGTAPLGTLKICVSCRYYPDPFTGGLSIAVEEHNRRDIRVFVKTRLGPKATQTKMKIRIEEQKEIESRVIEQAHGNFQWAALVCNKVMKMGEKGKPTRHILQEIDAVPEDLNKLYEDLIKENPEDRQESLRLFQWVCFAPRPLMLRDLQWALVLSPEMEGYSMQDCTNNLSYRKEPGELINAITDLSRGLIYISRPPPQPALEENDLLIRMVSSECEDDVYPPDPRWFAEAFFIHQSVRDFLCHRGLSMLEDSQSDPIELGHRTILFSCLHYAFLEKRQTHEEILNVMLRPDIERSLAVLLKHHIESLESQKIDQSYILEAFDSSDGGERFEKLLPFICIDEYENREYDYVERSTNIRNLPQMLAFLGIASAFRSLVAFNTNLNLPKKLGKPEIIDQRISRISEHIPTVLERLESGTINLEQASGTQRMTTFHVAARFGRVDIINSLLECPEVDPNRTCAMGLTALHIAVDHMNREVVEVLSKSKSIDLNIQSTNGALAWDCSTTVDWYGSGLDLIFQSPRMDVNLRGNFGNTIAHLMIMTTASDPRIPKLGWSRVDPNLQNRFGESVLHLAIQYHCKEVVEALLEIEGVNLYLEDDDGDVPIFSIFRPAYKPVERFPSVQDPGREIISQRVDPLEVSGILELLLSKMKVLVKNRKGSTLLHCAMEYSNLDFVLILLRDGRIELNDESCLGKEVLEFLTLFTDIAQHPRQVQAEVAEIIKSLRGDGGRVKNTNMRQSQLLGD
ncbi:uncharacterized protein BKA78DRAFT_313503 [Phyllosticta capitalensis]|uniref:uncharacterized protein n=1 Tax=Phyllosticta capitalensis TaxID=121624 RepID=UPI00312F342A